MSFKVAIVGHPNVGKSSLFNRLIGRRHAITHDESGSTRDRIYGTTQWLTKEFSIIDTGGIEISDAPFLEEIKEQVYIALDEADVIIMLVDGQLGIIDSDYYISSILYESKKPIILAVNKIDDLVHQANAFEFYSLGLGDPIPISSHHGIGIGDLLDEIIKHIPKDSYVKDEDSINFAIIGRPNVGKSSLTNAILRQNRVIVSDVSGTTRDSIDTTFTHNRQKYTVVDTAGIKKRGRIYEDTDKYSVLRALEALERADVALLMIDASEGIILQDKHVAGYIIDYYKACVIVVNKWDTIEKDDKTMKKFADKVREEFKFLDFAEIAFISSKFNHRIETIFPLILKAYENYHREIPTNVLNQVLLESTITTPPNMFNRGRANFSYITQTGINPPNFLLFVNNPDYVHFSYLRYLNNEFRKHFDFTGTPIKFTLREKD